jgi:aryl-phospho-beta-D-glucosidase BglC (GH1 family)
MFIKLILILLIPIIWYGITVFVAPDTASSIDSTLWIPWFSENIRGTKSNFDSAITDIPSLEEFKSWALDLKDTVVQWVETTKDTIDSVRWWAQKAEDTFNQAKDTYDSTKDAIDEANRKITEFQSLLNPRATASWSTITDN